MAEVQEGNEAPGGAQVELKEQGENSRTKHLAPYQFKKGQSGNPNGRPPGKSLKERAKAMLQAMTPEEEQEFLEGIDKKTIWEMAEGKAKQDVEHGGIVTISHVLDSLEHDSGQETLGQGVADEPPVQNQEQATATHPVQEEQSPTPLQSEQVVAESDPEVAPTGVHNG